MKTVIAAFLITAVTNASAIAADCFQMDKIAESVMKARQYGVPMAKMYEASVSDDSYTSKVFRMLVDGAYKETRFSSPDYQEKAITDFRNVIFQACVSQQDKQS